MGTIARYYSTKAIELRLYAVDGSTSGTLPSSDSVGTSHQIELRDKNNGTTNFNLPASFPFTLIIDPDLDTEEVVTVTAATTNVYTITRGSDSSNIALHNTGAVVKHGVSARDYSDSRAHEAASSGVHDVVGTLVGTSDTQTLTNKTLTSPTINGGSVNGSATVNITGNITGVTVTGTTVNGTTLQHNGRTLPLAIASGSVALTTSASTTASAAVTWTAMSGTPVVVATADNAAFNISISNNTSSGCTINARHIDGSTSSISFNVYWVAVKN